MLQFLPLLLPERSGRSTRSGRELGPDRSTRSGRSLRSSPPRPLRSTSPPPRPLPIGSPPRVRCGARRRSPDAVRASVRWPDVERRPQNIGPLDGAVAALVPAGDAHELRGGELSWRDAESRVAHPQRLRLHGGNVALHQEACQPGLGGIAALGLAPAAGSMRVATMVPSASRRPLTRMGRRSGPRRAARATGRRRRR